MITITRHPECFTITGHAGAGPPGSDIVCSAVSTLFQTLILSIGELTDDQIEYDIAPGNSRMAYRDLSEEGNLLIKSFFIGISGIADAYPDNVTLIKSQIANAVGADTNAAGAERKKNDEVHEFEQVQSGPLQERL